MWNMRPWRKSPLMGTAYRVEFGMRAALLALLGLAALTAIGVGSITCANITREAAAAAVGARPADAVLDAAPTPSPYPTHDLPEVPAHWLFAGRIHTGFVEAALTSHKGDHVTALVRPNGDQLPATATRSDAVSDGISAGFAVFAGATGAVLLLDWWTGRMLQRRRQQAWDQEWARLASVRRWNHL
jgi:hypothetical protein